MANTTPSQLNIVAQLQLQGPTNLQNVVRGIRSQLRNIRATVDIQVSQGLNRRLGATTRNLRSVASALNQVHAAGQRATASMRALSTSLSGVRGNLSNAQQSFSNISKSAQTTQQATSEATESMIKFGEQSALAIRRFLAFSIPTGLLFGIAASFREGISSAIAFNRELIKVSQVTGRSKDALSSLTGEIDSLGRKWGASSADLVDVSRILSQAGLSAEDTRIALEALAQSTLAPTFTDINSTTEGSIAAMRQFGLEAENVRGILGSINSVASQFAVEADDIVSAIRRAGGAFQSAGGQLNELIALFTSVRSTTRESADSIATGFRTIFTRLQRPRTIEFLKDLNINLQDLSGQFVGPYEAVKRLNQALSELESTDVRYAQIIEELGGFRQVSKVIPLIQQFDSVAEGAFDVARQGSESIERDAGTALETLSVQLERTREDFLALFRDLTGTSTFQSLSKTFVDLAHNLVNVGDAVKPILPILALLGGVKAFGGIVKFTRGFSIGLKQFGNATNRLAGVQSQQNTQLQQQTQQRRQNNSFLSQNTTALNQTINALQQNTAALQSLRVAVSGRGISPAMPTGGRRTQRPHLGGEIKGYKRGGFVPGTGSGDTHPAMLEPGEFVLRKQAVKSLGEDQVAELNEYGSGGYINQRKFTAHSFAGGSKVRGYKRGGFVPGTGSTVFNSYGFDEGGEVQSYKITSMPSNMHPGSGRLQGLPPNFLSLPGDQQLSILERWLSSPQSSKLKPAQHKKLENEVVNLRTGIPTAQTARTGDERRKLGTADSIQKKREDVKGFTQATGAAIYPEPKFGLVSLKYGQKPEDPTKEVDAPISNLGTKAKTNVERLLGGRKVPNDFRIAGQPHLYFTKPNLRQQFLKTATPAVENAFGDITRSALNMREGLNLGPIDLKPEQLTRKIIQKVNPSDVTGKMFEGFTHALANTASGEKGGPDTFDIKTPPGKPHKALSTIFGPTAGRTPFLDAKLSVSRQERVRALRKAVTEATTVKPNATELSLVFDDKKKSIAKKAFNSRREKIGRDIAQSNIDSFDPNTLDPREKEILGMASGGYIPPRKYMVRTDTHAHDAHRARRHRFYRNVDEAGNVQYEKTPYSKFLADHRTRRWPNLAIKSAAVADIDNLSEKNVDQLAQQLQMERMGGSSVFFATSRQPDQFTHKSLMRRLPGGARPSSMIYVNPANKIEGIKQAITSRGFGRSKTESVDDISLVTPHGRQLIYQKPKQKSPFEGFSSFAEYKKWKASQKGQKMAQGGYVDPEEVLHTFYKQRDISLDPRMISTMPKFFGEHENIEKASQFIPKKSKLIGAGHEALVFQSPKQEKVFRFGSQGVSGLGAARPGIDIIQQPDAAFDFGNVLVEEMPFRKDVGRLISERNKPRKHNSESDIRTGISDRFNLQSKSRGVYDYFMQNELIPENLTLEQGQLKALDPGVVNPKKYDEFINKYPPYVIPRKMASGGHVSNINKRYENLTNLFSSSFDEAAILASGPKRQGTAISTFRMLGGLNKKESEPGLIKKLSRELPEDLSFLGAGAYAAAFRSQSSGNVFRMQRGPVQRPKVPDVLQPHRTMKLTPPGGKSTQFTVEELPHIESLQYQVDRGAMPMQRAEELTQGFKTRMQDLGYTTPDAVYGNLGVHPQTGRGIAVDPGVLGKSYRKEEDIQEAAKIHDIEVDRFAQYPEDRLRNLRRRASRRFSENKAKLNQRVYQQREFVSRDDPLNARITNYYTAEKKYIAALRKKLGVQFARGGHVNQNLIPIQTLLNNAGLGELQTQKIISRFQYLDEPLVPGFGPEGQHAQAKGVYDPVTRQMRVGNITPQRVALHEMGHAVHHYGSGTDKFYQYQKSMGDEFSNVFNKFFTPKSRQLVEGMGSAKHVKKHQEGIARTFEFLGTEGLAQRGIINLSAAEEKGLKDPVSRRAMDRLRGEIIPAALTRQSRTPNVFELMTPEERRRIQASRTMGQSLSEHSLLYRDFNLFARGGQASGSDRVPAMLTPGEFVVRKEAVDQIGLNNLKQLNYADKRPQKFAHGGQVQKFVYGGQVQKFASGGRPRKSIGGVFHESTTGLGMAGIGTSLALSMSFLQSSFQDMGEETRKLLNQVSQLVITFSTVKGVLDSFGRGANKVVNRQLNRVGNILNDPAASPSTRARAEEVQEKLMHKQRMLSVSFSALSAGAAVAASGLIFWSQILEKSAQKQLENAESLDDLGEAIGTAKKSQAAMGGGIGAGAGFAAGATIGSAIMPGLGTLIGGGVGLLAGTGVGGAIGFDRPAKDEYLRKFNQAKLEESVTKLEEASKPIIEGQFDLAGRASVPQQEIVSILSKYTTASDKKQRERFKQQITGQLSIFKGLKDQILDNVQTLEQFRSAYGGLGKEIVSAISVARGLTRQDTEKIIRQEIRARSEEIITIQELIAAQKRTRDELRFVSAFSAAMQRATASLDRFSTQFNEIAGQISGQPLTPQFVGTAGLTSGVFEQAAAGQLFDVDRLRQATTQVFGDMSDTMEKNITGLAVAARDLPQMLEIAATRASISGGDASIEALEKQLEARSDVISDEIRNLIIERFSEKLSSRQGGSESGFFQDVLTAPENLASKLVSSEDLALFKDLASIAKATRKQFDIIFKQSSEIAKFELDLAKRREKIVTSTFEAEKKRRDLLKKSTTLNIEEINQSFRNQQEAILGDLSPRVDAVNFDSISSELQRVQKSFTTTQDALQEARLNPETDAGDRDITELTKNLTGLNTEAVILRRALDNLSESTFKSAQLQEKLNKLEKQREQRFGLTERLAVSGPEDRLKFARSVQATSIAARTGTVEQFIPEIRSDIFDLARNLGEVRAPVFGRTEEGDRFRTGEEFIEKIVRNFPEVIARREGGSVNVARNLGTILVDGTKEQRETRTALIKELGNQIERQDKMADMIAGSITDSKDVLNKSIQSLETSIVRALTRGEIAKLNVERASKEVDFERVQSQIDAVKEIKELLGPDLVEGKTNEEVLKLARQAITQYNQIRDDVKESRQFSETLEQARIEPSSGPAAIDRTRAFDFNRTLDDQISEWRFDQFDNASNFAELSQGILLGIQKALKDTDVSITSRLSAGVGPDEEAGLKSTDEVISTFLKSELLPQIDVEKTGIFRKPELTVESTQGINDAINELLVSKLNLPQNVAASVAEETSKNINTAILAASKQIDLTSRDSADVLSPDKVGRRGEIDEYFQDVVINTILTNLRGRAAEKQEDKREAMRGAAEASDLPVDVFRRLFTNNLAELREQEKNIANKLEQPELAEDTEKDLRKQLRDVRKEIENQPDVRLQALTSQLNKLTDDTLNSLGEAATNLNSAAEDLRKKIKGLELSIGAEAEGRARGGQIPIFQPRGTDTVPAMLTPGEFVVRREAAQKNLPLLNRINQNVQYRANGGLVDGGMSMYLEHTLSEEERKKAKERAEKSAARLEAQRQAYKESFARKEAEDKAHPQFDLSSKIRRRVEKKRKFADMDAYDEWLDNQISSSEDRPQLRTDTKAPTTVGGIFKELYNVYQVGKQAANVAVPTIAAKTSQTFHQAYQTGMFKESPVQGEDFVDYIVRSDRSVQDTLNANAEDLKRGRGPLGIPTGLGSLSEDFVIGGALSPLAKIGGSAIKGIGAKVLPNTVQQSLVKAGQFTGRKMGAVDRAVQKYTAPVDKGIEVVGEGIAKTINTPINVARRSPRAVSNVARRSSRVVANVAQKTPGAISGFYKKTQETGVDLLRRQKQLFSSKSTLPKVYDGNRGKTLTDILNKILYKEVEVPAQTTNIAGLGLPGVYQQVPASVKKQVPRFDLLKESVKKPIQSVGSGVKSGLQKISPKLNAPLDFTKNKIGDFSHYVKSKKDILLDFVETPKMRRIGESRLFRGSKIKQYFDELAWKRNKKALMGESNLRRASAEHYMNLWDINAHSRGSTFTNPSEAKQFLEQYFKQYNISKEFLPDVTSQPNYFKLNPSSTAAYHPPTHSIWMNPETGISARSIAHEAGHAIYRKKVKDIGVQGRRKMGKLFSEWRKTIHEHLRETRSGLIDYFVDPNEAFARHMEMFPDEFAHEDFGNVAEQLRKIVGFKQGGVVHTSKSNDGTKSRDLQNVDFTPHGTDTVPAMLTPGEFVVRREAAQNNLPLLNRINQDTQYRARGGSIKPIRTLDELNNAGINLDNLTYTELFKLFNSSTLKYHETDSSKRSQKNNLREEIDPIENTMRKKYAELRENTTEGTFPQNYNFAFDHEVTRSIRGYDRDQIRQGNIPNTTIIDGKISRVKDDTQSKVEEDQPRKGVQEDKQKPNTSRRVDEPDIREVSTTDKAHRIKSKVADLTVDDLRRFYHNEEDYSGKALKFLNDIVHDRKYDVDSIVESIGSPNPRADRNMTGLNFFGDNPKYKKAQEEYLAYAKLLYSQKHDLQNRQKDAREKVVADIYGDANKDLKDVNLPESTREIVEKSKSGVVDRAKERFAGDTSGFLGKMGVPEDIAEISGHIASAFVTKEVSPYYDYYERKRKRQIRGEARSRVREIEQPFTMEERYERRIAREKAKMEVTREVMKNNRENRRRNEMRNVAERVGVEEHISPDVSSQEITQKIQSQMKENQVTGKQKRMMKAAENVGLTAEETAGLSSKEIASKMQEKMKERHAERKTKLKEKFGLQAGGHIGGSGRGDIVPAMLEPGEFVLNRSAVKALGVDNLSDFNRKYQKGGFVKADGYQAGGTVTTGRSGQLPTELALDAESLAALQSLNAGLGVAMSQFNQGLSQFNGSVSTLQAAFTSFANNATVLAEALSSIPQQIEVSVAPIQVVVSAPDLQGIEESVAKNIMAKVEEKLGVQNKKAADGKSPFMR